MNKFERVFSNLARRVVQNNKEHGEKLSQRRVELGLTVEDIAKQINMTKKAVEKLESGKCNLNNVATAIDIARAYKVDETTEVEYWRRLAIFTKSRDYLEDYRLNIDSSARKYGIHWKDFGDVIETARIAAGQTLKETSRKLGITEEKLEAIESGVVLPDESVLSKMSKLYLVPTEFLEGLYNKEIEKQKKYNSDKNGIS